MADKPPNIYRVEYEVDLNRVTKEQLQQEVNDIVKRLMDAAASSRGGGVSYDRSTHDKIHGKWG
jgi:hypothetical protein